MAATGMAAITNPSLIAAAKADLARRTREIPYVSPLSEDVDPPLDMSRC